MKSLTATIDEQYIKQFHLSKSQKLKKGDKKKIVDKTEKINLNPEWEKILIEGKFDGKYDWDRISTEQKLSEDFIREFADEVNWGEISCNQKLSEDFIREFADKVNWGEISCNQKLSEDFIREFADEVNWYDISMAQKLSEDFIREFADELNWFVISTEQKLSEDFIREFADEVNWYNISMAQKLSEDFIREFADEVNWGEISCNQKLSEDFIREFKDKVDWQQIVKHQELSIDFIKEFSISYIDLGLASITQQVEKLIYDKSMRDRINWRDYVKSHQNRSLQKRKEEMTEYAKKYNLEFDGTNLIAFREHDQWGRGCWNKTMFYEEGKYYRDWHCDMNVEEESSFGLGIWPEGNVKVQINVDDWGVWLKEDGKCRVWGFTILESNI